MNRKRKMKSIIRCRKNFIFTFLVFFFSNCFSQNGDSEKALLIGGYLGIANEKYLNFDTKKQRIVYPGIYSSFQLSEKLYLRLLVHGEFIKESFYNGLDIFLHPGLKFQFNSLYIFSSYMIERDALGSGIIYYHGPEVGSGINLVLTNRVGLELGISFGKIISPSNYNYANLSIILYYKFI